MQLFHVISNTQASALTAAQTTRQSALQTEPEPESEPFWGKDGFNFADVIDMVNPLQHLPVIAKYYREQSQDDVSEGSRLVGGALFGALMGGVAGILTSIANSAIRHETQNDVGEQLLMVVEDSLSDIFGNQDEESIAQQNDKSAAENPFFAQLFNENSNEAWPSYQDSLVQMLSSQKYTDHQKKMHDWGEV